jgi:carboxyl-terminal processing protease
VVRKWLGVLAILASAIICYEVYSSSRTVEVSTLNVEEKWQETGLATKDIENLFVNKHCHVNKKYFLACMNALSVLADKQGQVITTEGKILKNTDNKVVTEKERVQVWENIWEDNKSTKVSIEFLWKKLSEEIVGQPSEAMRVAQTFNAYLSVYKDPHTYILPKEYYEKVVAQSQNKISSYGFIVNKINNRFVFTRVFPDSIFEKSGVKKGDVLLEIDGVEVSNLSHDELLQLFKGKNRAFLKLPKKACFRYCG